MVFAMKAMKEITLQFKVNYSQIKHSYVKSPTFTAGGHEWCIICRFPETDNQYANFYLKLASESENVFVDYCFYLLNSDGSHVQETPFITKSYTFLRKCDISSCLFNMGPEWTRFLSEDCFTVVCAVNVLGTENEFNILAHLGLQNSLVNLMEKAEMTDVTFEVEGERFPAHKLILAAQSPVFRAQFFGSMAESGNEMKCVTIEDMHPDVFKYLLHFIYMDSVPDLDDNITPYLLIAADRYCVERLKLICEEILSKKISLDTVVSTLALSDRYSCNRLKSACIEFVALPESRLELILNEEFLELILRSPSLMHQIRTTCFIDFFA